MDPNTRSVGINSSGPMVEFTEIISILRQSASVLSRPSYILILKNAALRGPWYL